MSNLIPFPRPHASPAAGRDGSAPPGASRPVASAGPRDGSAPTDITRAVYTVKEVAHMLSLSLGSTYAMIRTGDIPARRMGGRWVIPKRRFHAWLDELPEASNEDVAAELARLDHAEHRRNA